MKSENRYTQDLIKISSIEKNLMVSIMAYVRKFENPEEGFNFVEEALNEISHYLHVNYDQIISELKEEKCKQTCSIS